MDQMLRILVALVMFAMAIPGQAQTSKAGVRDRAGLFSSEAIARADDTLRGVERETGWQVRIETVATLDGEAVRDRAIADAKALNIHGLYILISKGDHQVWVEPSPRAESVFPRSETRAIAETFTTAFRAREFDRGLRAAVQKISGDAARASAPAPSASETTRKPATRAPAPALPSPATPAEAKDDRARRGSEKATPQFFSLLVVGLGVLLVLWLVGRVFRHTTRAAPAPAPATPADAPYPAPAPGTGPGVPAGPRAGPGPGQAPRPSPPTGPAPGFGPPTGPAPGYGPPPYPAGPGYAVPPPAPPQGGGFVSGALGGLGGAVLGNILYDKFGRPHPAPQTPQAGGVDFPPGHADHGGADVPPAESTSSAPPPPAETYDPGAGAGGDWGPTEPEAATSPAEQDWSGGDGGGEWSGGDVSPSGGEDWSGADAAGAGGDWGSETAMAPEEDSGDAGAGGDWGGGDESSGDAGDGGAGGDWGDPGTGGDEEQGGSW